MTDAEICAEYARIWSMQCKRPKGPDPDQIMHIVTAKSDKTISQVREIIRNGTFTPPN
jgi:hypothetical protein